MNLNSLIRIFFTNKELYEQLDEKTKETYYFMLNQYFARLYPTNADALNRKSIPNDLAMDVWSVFAQRVTDTPVGFMPQWYKLKKKKKEGLLKDFSDIDKNILSYYPELIEEVKADIENEKSLGEIKSKKSKKKKK